VNSKLATRDNETMSPEGWGTVSLQDLVEFALGGEWGEAPSLQLVPQTVHVNVIRGTEFRRWAKEKGGTAAVRQISTSSLLKRELREGDIVVEISGGGPDQPVGRTLVIDNAALEQSTKPLVCSNFCRQLRLHPNADSAFVNFSLIHQYKKGRFNIFQTETTNIRNLNFSRFLAETTIPLPPTAEQKRISSQVTVLLAQVSRTNDHLFRVAAIMKRFRQAVLAAACSGRVTEDWRDSSAPDWKECTLAQILREPLRNGHSARASLNGSGVRTLTLSAVTYGDFSERNTKLTVADPRRVANLWLHPGDILIERSNSRELVGTARLYQGPANFAIYPDLLIRVRLNEEASPAFLEMVLQADSARHYFISSAQGTQGSMPKIDQQIILDFPLKLPPMKEQKEIVQRVTVLLALASQIEGRINAATVRSGKLTRSILTKAFRGELVPTEAELARREGREYEPASVLLDRINRERATEMKPSRTKRGVRKASALRDGHDFTKSIQRALRLS
jgi:type I restriction enzyme, S subunit